MQEQMSDLVTERVPGELIGRVAEQEKTSTRGNATGPGFQLTGLLEFLPILRTIEEIEVRLMLGRGGVLLQFGDDDAEVELRLDRRAAGDKTPNIVIDEVIALGVSPIVRMEGERDCAQRVLVGLAELGERNLLETVQALRLSELSGGRRRAEKEEETESQAMSHRRSRSYIRARSHRALSDRAHAFRYAFRNDLAADNESTLQALPTSG